MPNPPSVTTGTRQEGARVEIRRNAYTQASG
jgi:hypothetical protein